MTFQIRENIKNIHQCMFGSLPIHMRENKVRSPLHSQKFILHRSNT